MHGGRARLSVRISVDRHKAACTLIALHTLRRSTLSHYTLIRKRKGVARRCLRAIIEHEEDRWTSFSSFSRLRLLFFFAFLIFATRMQQFEELSSCFGIITASCVYNNWTEIETLFVKSEEINEKESSWINWRSEDFSSIMVRNWYEILRKRNISKKMDLHRSSN